jgi:Domain of unknown function (DUF4382)
VQAVTRENTMHDSLIRRAALASAIGALLLSACGGGDSTGVGPQSSTLSLSLTDGPLSTATKVWVQFAGVEIKPVNAPAQTIGFAAPKGFDLLLLRNGNAAMLLNDTTVSAGDYEWIRLILDPAANSSYVEDATGRHFLRIPSGAETGLKLVRGFTMPAGGRADFTIDFVLDKSIIRPPGQAPDYMMKPVLRITDNMQVGVIAGTFASQTLLPVCNSRSPTVYLYQGANVVPDDIYNPLNGGTDSAPAVDPLVTASPALINGVYTYRIGYVPVGTYTVAFTCDNDDPAVDENAPPAIPLNFIVFAQPVTVTVGQTSTVNF